jgi:hypothetical protein
MIHMLVRIFYKIGFMKILIQIALFLLYSVTTFAATEVVPIPSPDFNYKTQIYPHVEKDIDNLLTSFDQFFLDRELNQIILPEGFTETKTSLATINRIYSGDLGNTVVFIKAGVIPSLNLLMEKPVQIGDGYLQHFKQSSGLVVAVFVRTKNWENASEIFSNLKPRFVTINQTKKQNHSLMESWTNVLIGSADAQDTVHCDPKLKSTQGSLDKLIVTANSLTSQASPIQHITGCAMSAIKGVWDGSGGAVIGGVKGVGEFLWSPVESGKKYWESANKLWDVTKHFFSDFENEARKLYPAFDSLDPLVKSKLACQVIGTIGGGVLLTYLTVGVMSSAAAANVLLKIKTALKDAMDFVKYYKINKELATASVVIEKTETNLNKNLFAINRGTPESSLVNNDEVLAGLKNLPMNANSKRKVGLSNDEMQKLFRQVSDHPVASLSKVEKYEKNSPGMGYCFGRATTAHIKALMNGADKSSIRKVWALGDLKTGSTQWRYHVTTIVRDAKGEWYAIDPIMGKVMPVEKWYKEMKKFDSTGNMRIFDTEAKRFGPDSPGKYNPRGFSNKVYENYFSDLMESFKDETSELMSKRKAAQ